MALKGPGVEGRTLWFAKIICGFRQVSEDALPSGVYPAVTHIFKNGTKKEKCYIVSSGIPYYTSTPYQ